MSSQAATSGISVAADSGKSSSLPLILGVVGMVIALIGLFIGVSAHDSRPVLSLLLGFGFWFAVLLGMLFLIQLWYLFDAGWSIIIRRQLEHMIGSFKILGLIFLPILLVPFIMGDPGLVWKWMDPSLTYPGGHEISHDPLYTHKSSYLNVGFFFVRVLIYFAIVIGLAGILRKCSFDNDVNPSPANISKARKVSAAGIVLTALTTTFAAFDFYMSLSYHWFSTMYGVWYFTVAMRTALAVTILLCNYLVVTGPLKGIYKQVHNYLLGCLSLAFTVFWAYISFSQYFLIYNANIPEETFWYNIRELTATGEKSQWWYVSLALIFCHFLIPFLTLLFYRTKVVVERLKFISCWILFFCIIDLYFNIIPTKKASEEAILGYKVTPFFTGYMIFDIAALVGVGGLVIWFAKKSMAKTEVIPIHDPRIKESINYVQ